MYISFINRQENSFQYLLFLSFLSFPFMVSELFSEMSGSASNTSNPGSDENSSNPPPDPTQNPSSPYHIHPSESPSSVIIAPALVGNNYHSWSRSFHMALVSENKMGFLNGSIPAPAATDPLFPQWERCNTIIMS